VGKAAISERGLRSSRANTAVESLMPRPVFLEDESATPLQGFPVLLSEGMLGLRNALRDYFDAEETAQVSGLRRESHDVKNHSQAWERYVALLSRAAYVMTRESAYR